MIKKQKFLDYTDCIVPALAIAQAIGRWGNFVNQEAYGYETNSLFAIPPSLKLNTLNKSSLYKSKLKTT